MTRQFGDRTYLAIKAACRDLVTACGGPKMAAEKNTLLSKSYVKPVAGVR